MKTPLNTKKTALLLAAFLTFLCAASLAALLIPAQKKEAYIADIFQNGTLIMSISLNDETESRTFTITGENGCTNDIEIRPGSIGILSADCPDKLCVRQGFINDSKLPITCLPNRLVIQLRGISDTDNGTAAPDIVTY